MITTDRREIAIDCLVRNASGDGVKLVVPNTTSLPDQFELHIPRWQGAYRVRARWRQLEEVGVEIERPQQSAAPVPLALARRVKQLEAENAALKRRLAGSE
jgi:hypothetical protein